MKPTSPDLAEALVKLKEGLDWRGPNGSEQRILTMHRDLAQAIIDHFCQPTIWETLTDAQKQHCLFLGFDPDNPNVPLD